MKKTVLYIAVAIVLLFSTCVLCSCTTTCNVCNGKGEIRCPDCNGLPRSEPSDAMCLTCGGSGSIDLVDVDGSIMKMPCATCNGTGHLFEGCQTCKGIGTITCPKCDGKGEY